MHEFWRVLATVAVAGLAFIIVFAAGAGGRALILAWTRAPRHARDAAIDAEAKAHVSALRGELREVPEPGKDYISDQNVRLPRTPSAAELEMAAQLLAACDAGPPVVADITDARASRLSEPEDWAESTFVQALLALPLDRVHLAFDGVRQ